MDQIQTVCVVGAGRMGREIALNAAVYGHKVTLTDTFPQALEQAKNWAEGYVAKSVEKGKMTRQEADDALARCSVIEDLGQAVKDADLVIECIIEDVDAKKELFRQLDQMAPAEALLVTNSSYLPSSRFAPETKRPSQVANLHYFNPAMRMELVEIVKGPHVSEHTVELLKQFADSIHKTAIVVRKELDGFVVNRIVKAVADEAFYLLDNGVATFEEIDMAAEKGLNYPMGPFRLMDFTGLDITYRNRKRVYDETGDEKDRPSPALKEHFDKGEFGRKTGKGWYSYE